MQGSGGTSSSPPGVGFTVCVPSGVEEEDTVDTVDLLSKSTGPRGGPVDE